VSFPDKEEVHTQRAGRTAVEHSNRRIQQLPWARINTWADVRGFGEHRACRQFGTKRPSLTTLSASLPDWAMF
jgi:hypothetical protein